MASKEKDEQDRSSENSSASETDKESRSDKDDADGDEGQLSAIKKKTGEPDDNLRRRAEWFQKRHRG